MRKQGHTLKKMAQIFLCTLFFCLITFNGLHAQAVKSYTIKDGKMYIALGKNIRDKDLEKFIEQYSLHDLDLERSLRNNSVDSLRKLEWRVEINNDEILIISKRLAGVGTVNAADKIIFAGKEMGDVNSFPSVSSAVRYGGNKFRNKFPFATRDLTVTFFLRNNMSAKHVLLAGSFNNWSPDGEEMTKTDSGWISRIKLTPGKYWYKFIIDGNWTVDTDNVLTENDGRGNTNSVFYKTNTVFRLTGFMSAKKVAVAGSFNNWDDRDLQMVKVADGWQLPVYLADGTHTYRFVIDKKWIADPANPERVPNEFNDFNSVIRMGKSHLFKLNGYKDAKQVILTGSFNGWKNNELFLGKTATGWELPYSLAAGNYDYKFLVDGRAVLDPAQAVQPAQQNSFLVMAPNHQFRLKGFANAKSVFLAGDFNNWNPTSFAMKKEGDGWMLDVHLDPGKHTYKFVVDGKNWIKDPGNAQWEENEHGSGNSVVWF